MKRQAKQGLIGFSIALLFFSSLLFVLDWYLNLPVVAFNQYDKCEWVRTAPDFEKRACPLNLFTKYQKQHVRSYDATSSGHFGISK